MNEKKLNHIKAHASYQYALDVVEEREIANKYVKIQCQKYIDELENPDSKYWFDAYMLDNIDIMTDFIKMPSGIKQGATVKTSLAGFQWFFIVNALCWKMQTNHEKRRYEKSVLLIARKSGKTFLTAVLFILLLLLEPQYSDFYSVAPDLELSSLILKEITHLIEMSPVITKRFKINKGEIECLINHNTFKPLATSNNRMDGRKAAVFVADEVGALANRYPIEAMESSQMNSLNRTGILISTAYESLNNPMTQEVDYAEKVLSGEEEDEKLFALLYKPDNPDKWKDDDDELLKANPLAIALPDNLEFLKGKRKKAIITPESRKNFLTKHMNIFVNGEEAEAYISEEDISRVEMAPNSVNWYGKDVFVGLDLSRSNDNTAISMASYDEDTGMFYAKSWAFIPAGRMEEKKNTEKVDYPTYVDLGTAYAIGDRVIDYDFIEEFILNMENEYGVTIKGIGYDRWGAPATVTRLGNAGYETFEIKQNAEGLFGGTKLLKEKILSEEFVFEQNELLKQNFLNARMVTNASMAYYLNKKKSNGKIDMVAALVNAMVLWDDEMLEDADMSSQQGRPMTIL